MERIEDIIKSVNQIYTNKEINFYCKADADASGFIISLIFSFVCWFLTKLTGNYSWVDRFWSLIPTIFTYHFNLHSYICQNKSLNERQLTISILSTLWSMRLTYNFYRKGGYNPGGEDYRWQIVKKNINNAFLWELLNIFFIAIIQNILLYLIATPVSLAGQSKNFNVMDFSLIAIYLILLVIETASDQQQWNFQETKKRMIANKEALYGDYKRGFITSGLFKYSRHPNFFAEMSIWWIVYLFSVNATGVSFNWTILGTFFLTLLFQASTKLTEDISVSKYPEYALYQAHTSRFIPLPSSFDKTK